MNKPKKPKSVGKTIMWSWRYVGDTIVRTHLRTHRSNAKLEMLTIGTPKNRELVRVTIEPVKNTKTFIL